MPGEFREQRRPPRYECEAEREAVEYEHTTMRCGEEVPQIASHPWWTCSRRRGHTGQHIAANGIGSTRPRGEILARWGWEG